MIIKSVDNYTLTKNSYNSITVELDVTYDEEVTNESIDAELVIVSDFNELVYTASVVTPASSSSSAPPVPTSPRSNLTVSYYIDADVFIEDTGGESPLTVLFRMQGHSVKKQILLSI